MIVALLASAAFAGDGVRGVLWVQPFHVDRAFVYGWTAERPQVTDGTVIVVDVDPAFAVPRDARMPVLYVGATPAEWINTGYPDGRIVALVPGTVDWATTPVFYGPTALPEQIDAQRGQAVLQAALAGGAAPWALAAVTAVTHPTLLAADETALRAELADLIDRFAPSERERATLLRLPAQRRP